MADGEMTGRRPAWWLPLLIPGIILPLLAIDVATKGTHVVHTRPIGTVVGELLVGVITVLPGFVSGVLYARRSN